MNEQNRPGVGEENSADFHTGWMLYKERHNNPGNNEEAEEDDEDEKDSTGRSKKRFRRFLSRLFPVWMGRESKPINEAKERPFNRLPEDQNAPFLKPSEYAEQTEVKQQNTVEENYRQDSYESVQNADPENQKELKGNPIINAQNTEAANQEHDNSPGEDSLKHSEQSYQPMEAVVWQADRKSEKAYNEPVTKTPNQEIRGSGAGAAIGLIVDQLSRRRDRKLKRAVRRAEKQMQDLQEKSRQLEQHLTAQNNLSKRPETDQAGQAKDKTEVIASKPPTSREFTVANSPESQKPVTGNTPEDKIKNGPENKHDLTEKSIEQPQKLEKILDQKKKQIEQLKELNASPERVLQEIEAAVEKNVALEAAFERSHEAKDQPDKDKKSPVKQAANNNGSTNFIAETPPPVEPPFIPPPVPYSAPKRSEPQQEPSLYKKAALSGFWVGIIIFAILVVLLVLV